MCILLGSNLQNLTIINKLKGWIRDVKRARCLRSQSRECLFLQNEITASLQILHFAFIRVRKNEQISEDLRSFQDEQFNSMKYATTEKFQLRADVFLFFFLPTAVN